MLEPNASEWNDKDMADSKAVVRIMTKLCFEFKQTERFDIFIYLALYNSAAFTSVQYRMPFLFKCKMLIVVVEVSKCNYVLRFYSKMGICG